MVAGAFPPSRSQDGLEVVVATDVGILNGLTVNASIIHGVGIVVQSKVDGENGIYKPTHADTD